MLPVDAMISRTLPWAPLGLFALLCACSEPTTNYGPPEGLKGASFSSASQAASSSQGSSSQATSSSPGGAPSSQQTSSQSDDDAGDAGVGGDDAGMDTSKASS